MAFYEGVHRGNKKCRANALPGTIVRLDHPDRNDKVVSVDGAQLRLHAEDRSVATGDGAFIQHGKDTGQLRAGIGGLFYLK